MNAQKQNSQVSILISNTPTFNSGRYYEPDLLVEIISATIEFLDVNSDNGPDKNLKIGNAFANHIIRTRSDWKPQDIPALFNFITDRKDIECNKVYGNKIMLQHLITSANAYEDERIEAREILHEQRKSKEREHDFIEPINNPHLREILDRLNKKTEPKPIEPRTEPDHVQDALMDFDQLFFQSGKVINGIRYVELNGIFASQDEFLKTKNERKD